ncbi:rRNA biogenesis protein RRP36 like protein [Aduncisulcus paluster]|uniref:rRNA biogenesis protein RRP36 n=1 Tax=Aduncisulcus paluster TaxID=2918883 RepID=A0ABQ5KCE0_9EUKA|nr:rRNA biogenesis protein RRP36 like protein [Aduncisulcus paluster]
MVRSSRPAKTHGLGIRDQPKTRDPRFFGSGDTKQDKRIFSDDYKFLETARRREIDTLGAELETIKQELGEDVIDDPEYQRKTKLRTKLYNAQKESEYATLEKKVKQRFINKELKRVSKGKKAYYVKNKHLKKAIEEEKMRKLKKEGRLKKYKERKRHQQERKDDKMTVFTRVNKNERRKKPDFKGKKRYDK